MATEHIIRVTFGGNGVSQEQDQLDPKQTMPQLDVKSLAKSIGTLAVVGYATKTISNYISVSSQISGATMYMNQLTAPKRTIGLAMNAVSDPIGFALELEQYRSNIDKEEKKQNNLRAIVGLEATNNSRYGGQRR